MRATQILTLTNYFAIKSEAKKKKKIANERDRQPKHIQSVGHTVSN